MKKGFTLVELLVVVAIIGVLAALIFPAIRGMTGRADAVRCLANLKALGSALQLYLGDNQQTMPALVTARTNRSDPSPAIDTVLAPYAGDPKVFACPADTKIAAESGTSYYWNSALNGQAVAALNFLTMDQHSRIPVMLDKEGWHRHMPEKVNYLFADGHATQDLRLFTE